MKRSVVAIAPMISVIIPVFNTASRLRVCVESVLHQSYNDIEIILVDDGSTDGSGRICDELAKEDRRIRVIHQNNRGVSSARNRGIKAAYGEYISFVDSDDEINQSMLMTLHEAIVKNDCDLAVCGITAVTGMTSGSVKPKAGELYVLSREEAIRSLFNEQTIANGPVAKLYKRRLFKDLKFPAISVGEDLVTNYHYLLKTEKIVVSETPLYTYIERRGSAMCSPFSEKRMESLYALRQIVLHARKNVPSLGCAAEGRLFMEALYIIWAMQPPAARYKTERAICIREMRRRALRVVIDKKSRVRNRAYATVALVSVNLLIYILNAEKYTRELVGKNQAPKKVLIRHYGTTNLGDDLFVKVLAERYVNEFSAISHSKADSLGRLPNLRLYTNKLLSLMIYYLDMTKTGRNFWLRMLARKNDLMVYIGGSIFIERDGLEEWERERYFYKHIGIPYYIIGANFGPCKTPAFKALIKNIVADAADVCFRDEASRYTFQPAPNVRAASDVVFSLDTTKYRTKTRKLAVFSIINCRGRFEDKQAEQYDRNILAITESLSAQGYSIAYMSFCKSEGDEVAITRIRQQLDPELAQSIEVHNYRGDIDEALSLLAQSEIVVATRFHAVILGLLFSKKVLPILYSDKTFEVLKDIGFTGESLDIRSGASLSKLSPDMLTVHGVDKQITDAERHFVELDKILLRKDNE